MKLDELEKDVQALILQNQINPKFYKLGLEVLSEMHELETDKRQQIYETQHKNVEDTQKKLDRILASLSTAQLQENNTTLKSWNSRTSLRKVR